MCYSATANFVGGSVVGAVGVGLLTQVRHRREIIFASLSALFGLHQLIESVVWLGLEGHASRGTSYAAAYMYVLYAQRLLPVLMPLGTCPRCCGD